MPSTGEIAVLTLTVGGADTDTEATAVAVHPVTGAEEALTARLDAPPDRSRWTANLVPTVPGAWPIRWTVTGSGAGIEWDEVLVSAAPGDVPDGRVYATTTDLARWPGATLSGSSRGQLAEASRALDTALIGARYAHDDDGYPTSQRIRDVFRDAVCAQVAYWDETGDATGAGAAEQFTSVGVGPVQLSRAGRGKESGADLSPDIDAPAALRILRNAGGLFPIRPEVYG